MISDFFSPSKEDWEAFNKKSKSDGDGGGFDYSYDDGDGGGFDYSYDDGDGAG